VAGGKPPHDDGNWLTRASEQISTATKETT
jgi:hypothetical protein